MFTMVIVIGIHLMIPVTISSLINIPMTLYQVTLIKHALQVTTNVPSIGIEEMRPNGKTVMSVLKLIEPQITV